VLGTGTVVVMERELQGCEEGKLALRSSDRENRSPRALCKDTPGLRAQLEASEAGTESRRPGEPDQGRTSHASHRSRGRFGEEWCDPIWITVQDQPGQTVQETPISDPRLSHVARITDVSHWCLTRFQTLSKAASQHWLTDWPWGQ
jgi:hypothetical protein